MENRSSSYAIYGAYYLTLAAILAASFFPEYRVWGLNWWAYYPDWVRWGLFGIGALAPVVVRFIGQHEVDGTGPTDDADTGDRKFFVSVGVIAAGFVSLFYLFRARTHFLGDGYTLLSSLATDSPLAMKTREYGESLLHIALKKMIGGDGQAAALLSYQIISITAGLLFVLAVALFARKLYERSAERVLFLLGICTGGFMLLFFGYVENYSLFVLSVLIYSLTGLLIARGKTNRYWLVPPLVAAGFFHVLGVTLIPSALYLWIGPSRFGRTIRSWRLSTKLIALVPIIVVAAVVFHHFYTTSYFFRFAFVPFVENRFTVEGYTMFSISHLVDFVNLLFLLVPGLLIVIVLLLDKTVRRRLKQRSNIYLHILTASVLGAVFIFDPKLGMPRDWDLFAFAGVPVAVTCYYLISTNWQSSRVRYATVLSIILCFLVLMPRVGSGLQSSVALNHFRCYLLSDIDKGRNGWIYLKTYYLDQGDTLLADFSIAERKAIHPEVMMVKKATRLLQRENRIREAKLLGLDIIRIAPTYPDAYGLVGVCNIYLRQYTEALAYLRIADGLSPDRSATVNNLGQTYQMLGKLGQAESAFLRSSKLDTNDVAPIYNLAVIYRDQHRTVLYEQYLSKAAAFKSSPAYVVAEWGDYLMTKRQFNAAAEAYRRAMQKGLDSTYVVKMIQQYPQLGQHLK